MKLNKILVNILSSTILFNNFFTCFAEQDNIKNINNTYINNILNQEEQNTDIINTNINTIEAETETENKENINNNTKQDLSKTNITSTFSYRQLKLDILRFIDRLWCKIYFKFKYGWNKVYDNKYTPKQRGLAWCAISCLEGLLKKKNINNCSQEDIYKFIFKEDDIPEHVVDRYYGGLNLNFTDRDKFLEEGIEYNQKFRKELIEKGVKLPHLPFYNQRIIGELLIISAGQSYASDFAKYVENLTDNKLTCVFEHIDIKPDPEIKNIQEQNEYITDKIMNSIIEKMENYGAISIMDSFVYSRNKKSSGQHMVNIINIKYDEEYNKIFITVEDPATGISREENIYEFVKDYSGISYNSAYFKGIPIVAITENTHQTIENID